MKPTLPAAASTSVIFSCSRMGRGASSLPVIVYRQRGSSLSAGCADGGFRRSTSRLRSPVPVFSFCNVQPQMLFGCGAPATGGRRLILRLQAR